MKKTLKTYLPLNNFKGHRVERVLAILPISDPDRDFCAKILVCKMPIQYLQKFGRYCGNTYT